MSNNNRYVPHIYGRHLPLIDVEMVYQWYTWKCSINDRHTNSLSNGEIIANRHKYSSLVIIIYRQYT